MIYVKILINTMDILNKIMGIETDVIPNDFVIEIPELLDLSDLLIEMKGEEEKEPESCDQDGDIEMM